MGLYGEQKDYETLIQENIDKSRLLFGLSDLQKQKILSLLKQKESILQKNGFLANYKLQKINKKMEKIRKKSQ